MFYVMINHEQSADSAETLEEARVKGQQICDDEPVPGTFSIYDEDQFVEYIERGDGRDLSDQIRDMKSPTAKPL